MNLSCLIKFFSTASKKAELRNKGTCECPHNDCKALISRSVVPDNNLRNSISSCSLLPPRNCAEFNPNFFDEMEKIFYFSDLKTDVLAEGTLTNAESRFAHYFFNEERFKLILSKNKIVNNGKKKKIFLFFF